MSARTQELMEPKVTIGSSVYISGLALQGNLSARFLGIPFGKSLRVFGLWLHGFPRDGRQRSSCQPSGSTVGDGVRGRLAVTMYML